MGRPGAGRPSPWLRPAPEATPEADRLSGRSGVAAAQGSGEAPRVRHHPPRTASVTRLLRLDGQPPVPVGRVLSGGSGRMAVFRRRTATVNSADLLMSRLVWEGYDGAARRERQGIKG